MGWQLQQRYRFLSTLSLRRATNALCSTYAGTLFLSTLSLRRATWVPRHCRRAARISIHALLAESDECPVSLFCMVARISIHALLAESDRSSRSSTASTRYFYPRSPCGERRWPCTLRRAVASISIHALLAESDIASP